MHKTQLYLQESQYLILRDWAAKRKKSIAQLVRELIDAAISAPGARERDPLLDIVGMAAGDYSNVSQNVDAYLYGDAGAIRRLEAEGKVRDARGARPRRKKK